MSTPNPEPGARRGARIARRRRTRWIAAGLVATALVAVAGLVGLRGDGGSEPVAVLQLPPIEAPTTTVPTTAPAPQAATVATTRGGPIVVYPTPEDPTPKLTLSPKTDYLVARTLLVTQQRDDGWLEVLLPVRPNGDRGWIRTDGVTLSTTDYAIEVSLTDHHLVFRKGTEVLLETQVVIGKASTPTPPGVYYITDPVDLQRNPTTEYGAFALGISGFSEVLYEFAGGPGQLAVHGTPRPHEVGQDLSNGCVRVPDDVVMQIARSAPLGTPVIIT